MRKTLISLLLISALLAGCTPVMDNRVSYEQVGNICHYTEQYGRTKQWLWGKETFEIYKRNAISYSNTNCSEIIKSDLKNNINKKNMFHVNGTTTVIKQVQE